jgi:hypothetical protein
LAPHARLVVAPKTKHPTPRSRQEALVGFWDLVDKSENEGGHWIWRGAVRASHGLRIPWLARGKYMNEPAHRLAWELTFGSLAPDTKLRHKCEEAMCVNPKHFREYRPGQPRRGRPPRSIYAKRAPAPVALVPSAGASASAHDVALALAQSVERPGSPLLEAVELLRLVRGEMASVRALLREVRELKAAVGSLASAPAEAAAPAEGLAAELRLAVLAAVQEAKASREPFPCSPEPAAKEPEVSASPTATLCAAWKQAGFEPISCPEDEQVLGDAFDYLIARTPATDHASVVPRFVWILARYRELTDAGSGEASPAGLLLEMEDLMAAAERALGGLEP